MDAHKQAIKSLIRGNGRFHNWIKKEGVKYD